MRKKKGIDLFSTRTLKVYAHHATSLQRCRLLLGNYVVISFVSLIAPFRFSVILSITSCNEDEAELNFTHQLCNGGRHRQSDNYTMRNFYTGIIRWNLLRATFSLLISVSLFRFYFGSVFLLTHFHRQHYYNHHHQYFLLRCHPL